MSASAAMTKWFKTPQARLRDAYVAAFSGPAGEAVLADLLKFCNAGGTSFVPGAPDATAFEEGKRRVALRIAGYLNMTDEKILEIANRSQGHAS